MKKIVKAILGVVAVVLIIIIVVFRVSIMYVSDYKITTVDTSVSSDETYELVLQAVGEADFPFGSASGRLILYEGKIRIANADFEIANDGASFSAGNWKVTWYDSYVEIILSGEEQYDELVILYYDGQTESCRLATRYGVEAESASDDVAGYETDTGTDSDIELFTDEGQITAGYQAIYELYSDNSPDHFEVYYGASESSTRCVLSETENNVEYLVYSGKSENGKCGVYAHYRSDKNADGTWTYVDGEIVDIYAYVCESGNVVSSGKTQWEDVGSEDFQRVTGEQ